MTVLLEVKNLVKNYGLLKAVDDFSLAVETGCCFGLLGPNGAGKTTALEMIEDIIEPTAGVILYKGKPRVASFHEEIGIQFQHTALLNFLTVRETLLTFLKLYRHTYDLSELIRICNLEEIQQQYNDRISGGQRQRLLLALALINRPELLFLDEPSTGLDPQARRHLWDIVLRVKEQGKTIILTTHSMEEAQYLCDEVAIMDHGRIIERGSPAALIKKYCRAVTVILPRRNFNAALSLLPLRYQVVGDRVEIQADNINDCLEALLAHEVNLAEMTVRSPNLEDVFLRLTGRQLRE